jgi:hypothetical protein
LVDWWLLVHLANLSKFGYMSNKTILYVSCHGLVTCYKLMFKNGNFKKNSSQCGNKRLVFLQNNPLYLSPPFFVARMWSFTKNNNSLLMWCLRGWKLISMCVFKFFWFGVCFRAICESIYVIFFPL